MADELSTPLSSKSQRRKFKARIALPRRWPLARLSFAGIALILAVVALRMALINDPEGGRPSAQVAIGTERQENTIATQVASEPAEHSATITPLDAAPAHSGSGPQITTVGEGTPDMGNAENPGSEPNAKGIIPDLVEETRNGPIPRMGAQGQTPFAAYSRASISSAAAAGKPMISIIVTGLGLNESGTMQAITALPDNVTLAFAPYGKALGRTTAAARAEGHELFLQMPMEPFDYPDNDPGPDTLLTGQPPRANIERLFTLMARFGGYAAVMNYMGARFTASGEDFTPMMEELGARGLGYLDDGSSNRSLAPQLAQANSVPFARASVQLDTNPSRAPIMAALDSLEASARQGGSAIGVISALPVSIQAIAEWSQTLDGKGLVLVPATTLMKKP